MYEKSMQIFRNIDHRKTFDVELQNSKSFRSEADLQTFYIFFRLFACSSIFVQSFLFLNRKTRVQNSKAKQPCFFKKHFSCVIYYLFCVLHIWVKMLQCFQCSINTVQIPMYQTLAQQSSIARYPLFSLWMVITINLLRTYSIKVSFCFLGKFFGIRYQIPPGPCFLNGAAVTKNHQVCLSV